MTIEDAVTQLEALKPPDDEFTTSRFAHEEADAILLRIVDPEIAEAYKRVIERFPWWAFA